MKPLPKEHILHFVVDPVAESKEICVRNLHVLLNAPKSLTEEVISKAKAPLIMLTGAKEQVVDNEACESFFQKCPSKHKKTIQYPEEDHMLFHDNQQALRVANEIINFFN